jgi:Fe-S-cluster containining protein
VTAKIEKAADYYSDPALLGDTCAHMKVERHLDSQLRCPFYTEQWTCGIYPAPPLGCRTHIVYSPAKQCRTRKIIDYYDGAYFPHIYKAVECLSAMVHPDKEYEKLLADWFVRKLKNPAASYGECARYGRSSWPRTSPGLV